MKTKTYIITGATSGIGNAILKQLSNDNIIFAGYRNKEHLEELQNISANIFPFYIDYTKPETIKYAAEYIVSKCTKVDTLINVAGCVVAGPLENITVEQIRHQFDVNVFGHIEFMQNLLDILQDGKIINISSMASFGLFPFISPYCASKSSLDIFFNLFGIENKRNIKVVSIKPGVISTPLWSKSIKENEAVLNSCYGYTEEMRCVVKNAKQNEMSGLSVDQVVKIVLKADKAKYPKHSYTVGIDAFCAQFFAYLPMSIKNFLIKYQLESKIKSHRRFK